MIVRNVLLGAVALVALSSARASANDSSFGGSGSELAPMQETRVRMAAEDVRMVLAPDGEAPDASLAWSVVAKYTFENPTSERVRLQMGFPESRCDGEEDCSGRGGEFRNLATTVRGRPVRHRLGHVPEGAEWGPRIGRVHLFDVDFAPNETVEIEHRYTYDRSLMVADDIVYYLTRTGALWNGPIGRARFTIVLPYAKPWFIAFPRSFRVASVREVRADTADGLSTEIVLDMRNWTPAEDLEVVTTTLFYDAMRAFRLPCPDPVDVEEKGATAFEGLDRDQLALCHAAIRAKHGDPFPNDEAFRRRFYETPIPTEGLPVPSADATIVGPRASPQYGAGVFTPGERAYLQAMSRAMQTAPPGPSETAGEGPTAPETPATPEALASRRGRDGCGSCSAGATRGEAVLASIAVAVGAVLRVRRRRRGR